MWQSRLFIDNIFLQEQNLCWPFTLFFFEQKQKETPWRSYSYFTEKNHKDEIRNPKKKRKQYLLNFRMKKPTNILKCYSNLCKSSENISRGIFRTHLNNLQGAFTTNDVYIDVWQNSNCTYGIHYSIKLTRGLWLSKTTTKEKRSLTKALWIHIERIITKFLPVPWVTSFFCIC